MSSRLLSGSAVWETIHRLARQAKGRKCIATAYLGKGSAKALHLRRDDTLLCGLSLQNVKRGAVCAPDLLQLSERGVLVYGIESLHAKVYLIRRTAIIGSPNVSQTSQRLEEAAVLTTDPAVVREVRQWFAARCEADPVALSVLEAWAQAYRAPKGNPALAFEQNGEAREAAPPVRRGRVPARSPRPRWRRGAGQTLWWVWDCDDGPYDDAANTAAEVGSRAAKRLNPALSASRLDHLQLPSPLGIERRLANDARRGDLIITISKAPGGWRVEPTGTILVARRHGGQIGTMLTYALTSRRTTAPLSRFVRAAAGRGIGLPAGGHRTVAITDPREIRALVELASWKSLRSL